MSSTVHIRTEGPAPAAESATLHQRFMKIELVQRVMRWMDAMPRPPLAIEVSAERVAAARWSRAGGLEALAVEPLQPGVIAPSAVEPNILNPAAVREALGRACHRIHAANEYATLLLPDPVIRIFVHHFDDFPRSAQDAIPFLRWKLKKSVPFDTADTVLSYVRQASPKSGEEIVTTIARLRVIREYEELIESVGAAAGVVSGSSLAALSLLRGTCATLLARVSNRNLTTAIVSAGALCGYRCTELPTSLAALSPQALLEEIYPLAAYYQDAWNETIESVRISGLRGRFSEFLHPMEQEFRCAVQPLLGAKTEENHLPRDAKELIDADLDGLAGWMLNRD